MNKESLNGKRDVFETPADVPETVSAIHGEISSLEQAPPGETWTTTTRENRMGLFFTSPSTLRDALERYARITYHRQHENPISAVLRQDALEAVIEAICQMQSDLETSGVAYYNFDATMRVLAEQGGFGKTTVHAKKIDSGGVVLVANQGFAEPGAKEKSLIETLELNQKQLLRSIEIKLTFDPVLDHWYKIDFDSVFERFVDIREIKRLVDWLLVSGGGPSVPKPVFQFNSLGGSRYNWVVDFKGITGFEIENRHLSMMARKNNMIMGPAWVRYRSSGNQAFLYPPEIIVSLSYPGENPYAEPDPILRPDQETNLEAATQEFIEKLNHSR